MLSSVVLATALSLAPAQAGQLQLTNAHATYGLLGATRSDLKFLPGDNFFLSFDIEGLQVNEFGKVLYSMSIEFLNKDGKSQFRKGAEEGRDLEATNLLGGSRVPAYAFAEIGTDQPPGEYTLRVTVTDRPTKKTQTLSQKIQVLPKAFGMVRVQTAFLAREHVPAPTTGVVGQTLVVNCGVVGFEREKASRQPNVSYEMRILDESGKPTIAKPDVIQVNKDVDEKWSVLEVPFVLALNRPGKFTIELKATDMITKKSATTTLPLAVMEAK
jgi:hypothetical protein